jgi:hypothetical protein
MDLQPITYRGRTLAACTRNRMFLADELDAHPESPLTEFVIAMCLYAGAVLNGVLPGPYRDQDARAYARACLIPAEVLERAHRTPPAELRDRRLVFGPARGAARRPRAERAAVMPARRGPEERTALTSERASRVGLRGRVWSPCWSCVDRPDPLGESAAGVEAG